MKAFRIFILVLISAGISNVFSNGSGFTYSRVELKSFTTDGWRVSGLPNVRRFLKEDVQRFDIPVHFVGGDPRLIFYDENDTELKVVNIAEMTRDQIFNVFSEYGIREKKDSL